jgi:hypothetical protein
MTLRYSKKLPELEPEESFFGPGIIMAIIAISLIITLLVKNGS